MVGAFCYMRPALRVHLRGSTPPEQVRGQAPRNTSGDRQAHHGVGTPSPRRLPSQLGRNEGRAVERTGKRFGLGIDVGGTFTDIVVYDAVSGRQASHKELTTHDDPSEGVMAGIDRVLRESAIAPADIGRLVHATTLFSNALIERKGAPTGLITTRGFRDTLEIGRERKYELYDIRIVKPAPLVPRRLRLEVPERMAVDGSVRTPLDEDAVLAAAAAADGGGRHVGGHRLPALLRQPGPRAAGRELLGRALSQPHAVGLDRRGARDPRVRARLHDRHQRLHQAAGRALHRRAQREDRRPGDRRAAAADAVERRPRQHRGGQAHAGAAAGVGPGGRGARRCAPRCRRRRQARAGLRHGRHHRQAQRSSTTASPRSPTASRPRARSASWRAAACRCASRPWS